MKKTFLSIAMLALILSGCKDSERQTSTESKNSNDVEVVDHDNHEAHSTSEILSNDWMDDMAMNDGKKWDANIETTDGVRDMQKIIAEHKTETVEDYLNLATKLNDRKNTLVKQCTMEGPSHDNLHVFLHPLIEKIDLLLKTENTTEGSAILKSINANLDAYNNYFN